MPLFAFNKTGAPLALAAGNPIVTLPASAAPPARGKPFNVTSELRPNLTVDPVNGKVGGLVAGAYALLQAQVVGGQVVYEWTSDPEYATASLSVDGPQPGVHYIDGPEHRGLAVGALAGSHGTPSSSNPFLTKDDPSVVKCTTADFTVYADAALGNDANDGLTPLTPVKTLEKLRSLIPCQIKHHFVANIKGHFVVPWSFTFFNNQFVDQVTGLLDGGDGFTTLAGPIVSDTNGLNVIGLTTLGLTPDEHTGRQVRILTGPATGDVRTIKKNTAGDVIPTRPFSVDPGIGAEFDIGHPETTIEQSTTAIPFTQEAFAEHLGDTFGISGDGTLQIQRITFTGNAPVNITCGQGKVTANFAACVLDNPLVFWKLGPIFAFNGVNCICAVYDPTDYGLTTLLTSNQSGVGSVGGDGSVFVYDYLGEWCTGFLTIEGCFFNKVSINSGTNAALMPTEGKGSRIKELELHQAMLDMFNWIDGYEIGGFISALFPFPAVFPAVYMANASANFRNCVFADSSDGIYARHSEVRLGDNITGLNVGAGVRGNDFLACYLEDALVNVTLTGTAIGELTLDGVNPVAGGWAAIKAGTKFVEPTTLSLARIQANLS